MRRLVHCFLLLSVLLAATLARAEVIVSDINPSVQVSHATDLRAHAAAELRMAGVPEQEALARVAALTDAEVRDIADGFALQAAGGACCHADGPLFVLLLIVLLIAML